MRLCVWKVKKCKDERRKVGGGSEKMKVYMDATAREGGDLQDEGEDTGGKTEIRE